MALVVLAIYRERGSGREISRYSVAGGRLVDQVGCWILNCNVETLGIGEVPVEQINVNVILAYVLELIKPRANGIFEPIEADKGWKSSWPLLISGNRDILPLQITIGRERVLKGCPI